MDYVALSGAFNKMSLEQLREINRMVVTRINHLHTQRDMQAISKFRVGDLIEFVDNKRARKVQARIDRINTKSISCHELTGVKTPWRVSPHLCRLVGA